MLIIKYSQKIQEYCEFYSHLATSVFSFVKPGAQTIGNIDTYVYSSIEGTLESIAHVLRDSRINDAYALLRKYHDSTVINVYVNIYLEDNCSIDNFVVEQITNWLSGKDRLPEFRVMSSYIRSASTFEPLNELFFQDNRYRRARDRCNDHLHYNFFRNVLLNDKDIYLKNRAAVLSQFSQDIRDIFIFHLAYIFFLNGHYMSSGSVPRVVES